MDVKDLTGAGWLLLLITVVGALALGIPLMILIEQSLPPGRYPKLIFILPVVLIGAAIFWGGGRILASMNKPISKRTSRGS